MFESKIVEWMDGQNEISQVYDLDIIMKKIWNNAIKPFTCLSNFPYK